MEWNVDFEESLNEDRRRWTRQTLNPAAASAVDVASVYSDFPGTIRSCRAHKGMPLQSATIVKFSRKAIPIATVGIERRTPGGRTVANDVNVASVYGDARCNIIICRAHEGMPIEGG